MEGLYDKVVKAAEFISQQGVQTPRVGIILGSGLGGLAGQITGYDSDLPITIPYESIPNFPRSTAEGHAGKLIAGKFAGVPVVAMQGRFHLYEGWDVQQASLPVWVMKQLGVEVLFVSNAAGGVNPNYQVGDLMLIDDQLNLMFGNPLVGVNEDRLGPRFPDMSAPYDRGLLKLAKQAAIDLGYYLQVGTYVAMLGPTYETRAEYRMVRALGDAVGMSTVPEVVAARHADMRVMGMSVITNACSPDALGETTHEEVVAAANEAGNRMQQIVSAVIKQAVV